MDREMMQRLKTAGEYQKKAIRALFPEKMAKHLDVIENELKWMAAEALAELVKEHGTKCGDTEEYNQREQSGTRKVDIE